MHEAQQNQTLGLRSIDSLQLFVRDLSRTREQLVEQLGFRQAGLSGAEFEREHGARASLLESGPSRLQLITPLTEQSEAAEWLAQHGDGVARLALQVDDLDAAHALLSTRGASVSAPQERKQSGGHVRWLDVQVPFAALRIRLVQYSDCAPLAPGLISRAPRRAPYGRLGVGAFHHVGLAVVSVAEAAKWLTQTLGFERYWGIELQEHDANIRSLTVWDRESGLKLRLREQSEAQNLMEVGLHTENIADTVQSVRTAEGALRDVDDRYYRNLGERLQILGIDGVEEDTETLRSLQLRVVPAAPRSYQLRAEVALPAGLNVLLVQQKTEVEHRGERAA